MAEQRFFTPLKAGLLAVAIAYFAFTFHAMFTLSWIGEWEPLEEPLKTIIFVEDISATACLAFRFAASIIALCAVIAYLIKKTLSKPTAFRALRLILVFEGIYWLGLATTAGYSLQGFVGLLSINPPLSILLYSLFSSVIPTILEAIILPIILFIFAAKLNPNKPLKTPIKWGFITGTVFAVVFWLINTSIWVSVIRQKGVDYLWQVVTEVNGVETVTLHSEHLVSFITTAFGLLAVVIYTAYVTVKSTRTETLQDLKFGAIGIITLGLGLYFLWNYFSWVMFAGDVWNDWYRWLLGHNLDLWMLALPLIALPLLFHRKTENISKHS